jgi:hypothetical protein
MKIDSNKMSFYPKYSSTFCSFYIDTDTEHLICEQFDEHKNYYKYYDYGYLATAVDRISCCECYQIKNCGHSRNKNEYIKDDLVFETISENETD